MKVILITGASRGIGAATAKLAASHGYAVAVNFNNDADGAESVIKTIRDEGGKAIAIRADISCEDQVVSMFETLDSVFGPIEALVNNAGILEMQARVEDLNAERLNRIFTANVTGQFICCREAIKRMSTKYGGAGGAIVNVSSIAARTGSPGEYVDYAASKGAVDTLTIGLSREVAAEGIRVNAVRPAFIYTDIHASGGEPDRVNRIKDSIPMKRGGNVDEVAQAILWLVSDKSSYSTGTFIDVSGGK